MEPLGAGIGSVFVDADALAQATEGALGPGTEGAFGLDSQQVTGHLGAVLRVEPTAIELVARGDQTSTGVFTSPTDVISHLPSSTAFAFSFGGGGTAVTEQWESLTRQLAALAQRRSFDRTVDRLEAKYDIRLPADLVTLLGEDAVVAVDGEGLFGSVPRIGLRTVTEPTAAADLVSRLRPTLADLTAGFDITMEPVDDGLVVATTPEFADVLVNGPGGLLTDPGFVAAVPDATDASAVMWLDLAALGDAAALFDPSMSSMLKPLAGLGVSGGVRDDGQFLTMRLTFQED